MWQPSNSNFDEEKKGARYFSKSGPLSIWCHTFQTTKKKHIESLKFIWGAHTSPSNDYMLVLHPILRAFDCLKLSLFSESHIQRIVLFPFFLTSFLNLISPDLVLPSNLSVAWLNVSLSVILVDIIIVCHVIAITGQEEIQNIRDHRFWLTSQIILQ